jgi:hypothetical protein
VPHRSSLAGAVALLSALCALAAAGPARAGVPAPRLAVQSPATLPASAAVTGDVTDDRPVALTVALTPSDPAGLAASAEAVSTPGSTSPSPSSRSASARPTRPRTPCATRWRAPA